LGPTVSPISRHIAPQEGSSHEYPGRQRQRGRLWAYPSTISPTSVNELTGVLGRPAQYVDIPAEAWGQILSGLPGMSPHLIEHLLRAAEAHQAVELDALTDVIETIGGSPPKSRERVIAGNAVAIGLAQNNIPEEAACAP
jgi:NAD(P)H dehydrogenase (quinone)